MNSYDGFGIVVVFVLFIFFRASFTLTRDLENKTPAETFSKFPSPGLLDVHVCAGKKIFDWNLL